MLKLFESANYQNIIVSMQWLPSSTIGRLLHCRAASVARQTPALPSETRFSSRLRMYTLRQSSGWFREPAMSARE